MIIIGIDTGTNTGFAVNIDGEIVELETLGIIKAQLRVLSWLESTKSTMNGHEFGVCIEDARQRKWVHKDIGRERLRGVGSVCRDSAIWQEFCEHYSIPFCLVPPAHLIGLTKMTEEDFRERTGWNGKRTSVHARDAGIMTWKYHRLISKSAARTTSKDPVFIANQKLLSNL